MINFLEEVCEELKKQKLGKNKPDSIEAFKAHDFTVGFFVETVFTPAGTGEPSKESIIEYL